MTSVIVFILILSFLVVIHELGHFLVAKWRKVEVKEFGFGYPPRIVKLFKYKETTFSLNAIPFGGFVNLEGEEVDEETEYKAKKDADKKWGPFYEKSTFSRLAIILAGPIFNFAFGAIAFSIIFSFTGIPVSLNSQPRIEVVVENSPAAKAGIEPNTNIAGFIIEDDLMETESIEDVQRVVKDNQGEVVKVVMTDQCQEDVCPEETQQKEIYLRTQEETPEGEGTMGVVFSNYYAKFYPWYEMPIRGMLFGIEQAVLMGMMMFMALFEMLKDLFTTGAVPADVAGPVGIVHHAQRSNLASQGFFAVLSFAGMLSVNLAIMNILPIPALDGGRVVMILAEKIVGKKRVSKVEGYINYGGFIILLGLIILITIKDVTNIFTGA